MKQTLTTFTKGDLKALPRGFYTRPTLDVAKDLLGRYMVRHFEGTRLIGRVVEVEAYIGEHDPACHARFGQTSRNSIMYGQGGYSYVYFIYGMYNMFNIVTERAGFPAAVLIRAIEPLDGIETMQRLRRTDRIANLTNGPGKLCQAMSLDTSDSGIDLTGNTLYLSDGDPAACRVAASRRIGIKQGTDRMWRFYIDGHPFVSRLL